MAVRKILSVVGIDTQRKKNAGADCNAMGPRWAAMNLGVSSQCFFIEREKKR